MTLNRYAKRRDDNELDIVKALENVGAIVYRLDTPVDLLVGYQRAWYLIEVKQPKGKLTPGQEDFLEAASDRGGLAAVCRSATEALAFIGCRTMGVEIGDRRPAKFTSPWLDGSVPTE